MKGIKFNSEMVNAILEGRKTQTRRIIKVQPDNDGQEFGTVASSTNSSNIDKHRFIDPNNTTSKTKLFNNPYGKAGDLVFVKEAFEEWDDGLVYKADNSLANTVSKWKPAQHMKQHQSRITLRIKDISVERLQEISEEDARAEGFPIDHLGNYYEPSKLDHWQGYATASFSLFWSAIYKKPKEKWEANPFVWKIQFEVVK